MGLQPANLVTTIYNYDVDRWRHIYTGLRIFLIISGGFPWIYRIILIISGGFTVYLFLHLLFYYRYVAATSWKIIDVKLFCYELTHATKYITAVCIKNILRKRLLLCGDCTFFVSYLSLDL